MSNRLSGVLPFVHVENILNKINFAIGGLNQLLEYTEDKGYLSGGIQILEESYQELIELHEMLKPKDDDSKNYSEKENDKPIVRIVPPEELRAEPTKVKELDSSINLPHILDTQKMTKRTPMVTVDTPSGFNSIRGLDKLNLPKPNIIVQDTPWVAPEHEQPKVMKDAQYDYIPPAAPISSGYKLTPDETLVSTIEGDILEYLTSQKDVWTNINQICKAVGKSRATVNKYIKLLFGKGFVLGDSIDNRRGTINTWKLDRKYSGDTDRLKFIIELSRK